LEHEDPAVRRNAALLIGRLGEPSAVPVLARAMKDAEPGVRQHALEALARLGNAEARQELIFMSNSGIGSEEVFAVNALAELRDARLRETFRFKLAKGPHLETKLASARALGMLGARDGLDAALRALRTPPSTTRDPADPPEDQRLRVRQLAASALGAIGGTAAVESLAPILEKPADPRLQVSAAKAVLEIERTGRGLHAAVHGPAALGRGTRHCQAALGRATRHWTPEDRRTR
jgi:HEAT repeat protein